MRHIIDLYGLVAASDVLSPNWWRRVIELSLA